VSRDQQPAMPEYDPTGPRARRVRALKDLLAEREYDVPAEEVAARILRDAIVIVRPAATRRS